MGALIVESLNRFDLVVLAPRSRKNLMASCLDISVRRDCEVPFDNVFGARFDLFEVLGRKRAIEGEIIIKAFFQCRADRELSSRKDFFYGLGHDVGAAVTIDFASLGGHEGERFDTSRLGRRTCDRSVGTPVDLGSKHFGSRRIRPACERLANRGSGWDLFASSVREGNVNEAEQTTPIIVLQKIGSPSDAITRGDRMLRHAYHRECMVGADGLEPSTSTVSR